MTLSASGFDQPSEDGFPLQNNNTSHDVERTRSTQLSQCIVGLIEGRGIASEVGVACYSMETAECTVGQLADTGGYSRTLTFLSIHSPSRILVCDQPEAVQSTSKLFLAVAEHFESERMMACPRRMFSDNAGTQILTTLCLPELLPSLLTGLAKKYPFVP